jgi:hypothetical protein
MTSVDLYREGEPLRDDLTLLAFSINAEEEIEGEESIVNEMVTRT